MRLNKFIAHYSTFSRREADRAVQAGYVKVNGEVETNPARDINEDRDIVYISGKRVSPKNKYTVIVYNKPRGEIVSKKDPQGRRTIYDSLPKEFKHFKPVGRLDFASEGLLNIVGGCCGTSPEHIRGLVDALQGCTPAPRPEVVK